MHELIIIGGGPAGLAAAAYAVRKRMDALFISRRLGGRTNRRLLLPWVEDYEVIVGEETIRRFSTQLDYLDYMRVRATVTEIRPVEGGFEVVAGGQNYAARAVILATGARGQMLDVPGEREFEMKGLCYSAMTYAPLMVDKRVIVIGERMMAVRAVAELSRIATQVTLIAESAGDLDTPPARAVLNAENVGVCRPARVLEVLGDEYARAVVVEVSDHRDEIEADAIFVEKALIPNSDLVAGLVERDEQGFIRVDARNRTSMPGLFAAGDLTTASSFQVLMGLGDGERAALSAFDYVLGLDSA